MTQEELETEVADLKQELASQRLFFRALLGRRKTNPMRVLPRPLGIMLEKVVIALVGVGLNFVIKGILELDDTLPVWWKRTAPVIPEKGVEMINLDLASLAAPFCILVLFLYVVGAVIKDDVAKRRKHGMIVGSRWVTTDLIAPIQLCVSILLSIGYLFVRTDGVNFWARLFDVVGGGLLVGACAAFAANGSYDNFHGLKKWLQMVYEVIKSMNPNGSDPAGTDSAGKGEMV